MLIEIVFTSSRGATTNVRTRQWPNVAQASRDLSLGVRNEAVSEINMVDERGDRTGQSLVVNLGEVLFACISRIPE